MNWKKLLIGTWTWKRPFYSLLSIYLILCLFALGCADRLIFPAPSPSYEKTLSDLQFEKTEKGESIAMIHLPAAAGKPTIIYSHGNAEDLGHSSSIYNYFQQSGIGILAYDYPGYGQSSGKPTEEGCYRAIQAAWNKVRESGVKAESIFILGRSVGSGPSTWLASKNPEIAGLMLISPFTSAFDVAIPLPFPILPGDRFPNRKRVKDIHTPLLIIHGENDNIIRFSHGKKLFAASPAKVKKLLPIPNAGHNDLFAVAGEEVLDAVVAFALQQ